MIAAFRIMALYCEFLFNMFVAFAFDELQIVLFSWVEISILVKFVVDSRPDLVLIGGVASFDRFI
jgi:hypothetical protein